MLEIRRPLVTNGKATEILLKHVDDQMQRALNVAHPSHAANQ
jgi:hypothetical protein